MVLIKGKDRSCDVRVVASVGWPRENKVSEEGGKNERKAYLESLELGGAGEEEGQTRVILPKA